MINQQLHVPSTCNSTNARKISQSTLHTCIQQLIGCRYSSQQEQEEQVEFAIGIPGIYSMCIPWYIFFVTAAATNLNTGVYKNDVIFSKEKLIRTK